MGFLSATTTINLVARLTPTGRQKLVSNSNSLITQFSLGDSDTYYSASSGLTNGQVPTISGNDNGNNLNNGGVNYVLRSTLAVDSSGDKKPVEPASINISNTLDLLGYKTISGSSITQNKINLNNTSTDSLTNLFYSFSLPITTANFQNFTATTNTNGGFSDTALSGIAQTEVLVIGINNEEYSEIIDAKSILMNLETTASTYSIYSTLENTGRSLNLLDNDILETSSTTSVFGPNRVLLFSDNILRPNGGDVTKSWSTGYATNKPFSINGKEAFNKISNPNLNYVADKAIGVAYLDKGFLVITDPTIVNDYVIGGTGSTATTITFDTAKSNVTQQITCMAERGQFGSSTNPTWTNGDIPRITEVGLFDSSGTLIAIAKLNRSYEKPIDDMVAFNITITF